MFNDYCEIKLPLSNSSFTPEIPYYINNKDLKKYSFQDRNIELIKIIPNLINQQNETLLVNHSENEITGIVTNKEIKKITAFDFLVLAKYKNKYCNINLRLYLTTNPNIKKIEKNLTNIFGRYGYDFGRFALPYGSEVNHEKKTILISDCLNELVQEFDFNGNAVSFIRSIKLPFNRPADIKIKNNKIYVVEELSHSFRVLTMDGEQIKRVGKFFAFKRDKKNRDQYSNFEQPLFNKPLSISIDDEENIFVTDYNNYRIVKLSQNNKVLKVIGYNDKFDGKPLSQPYYLEFSEINKKLYLVDQGNNRILVFDKNGSFIFAFGKKGKDKGEFNNPHEIEIYKKKIYVVDSKNYRIQVFDLEGNYLNQINFGDVLPYPKTVARYDDKIFVGHSDKDAFITVWKDPLITKNKANNNIKNGIKIVKLNKLNKEFISKNNIRKQYVQFCSGCHDNGLGNAPKTKYAPDWKNRKYNILQMVKKVKSGEDTMLTNGGCFGCTEKEIKDIIKFMLPYENEY